MTEIANFKQQLPANIEELKDFVLVGREKLVAVRAEIRAIDKLNLAQEVRDQKKEECLMLSEALLDAEVKLGDLLKEIPRDNQFKGNQYKDKVVNSHQCNVSKPKHEVIKDLGFSKDQAHRFETLANNKDLVEQVKAEARENDDIPTRSRVLELAKERKKREEKQDNYNEYLDQCKKTSHIFHDTLYSIERLKVNSELLTEWKELLEPSLVVNYLEIIENSIPKLQAIKKFLKGEKL